MNNRIEERLAALKVDTSEMNDEQKFMAGTNFTFHDETMAEDPWYVPGGVVNIVEESKADKGKSASEKTSSHIGSTDPQDLYQYDKDKDGDIDQDDVNAVVVEEYTTKLGTNAVVASSSADLSAITTPAEASVVVASSDVMNTLTSNTYYKNVVLVGGEVNTDIKLNATNNITIDGLNISGEQGNSNGKIIYAAKETEIKNITVENGSTVYNVFEGSQVTNDSNYTGIEKLTVSDITIDNPALKHNVVNVYTPATNAKIIIKNSTFNITVDTSNVLRLANYLNAENVTVTFENVNWTYENSLSATDWSYAGLVIYQPSSSDVALTGDTSKIATWKFNFKNCKYNGEKVTDVNFGEHNQVIYGYNINKTGNVSDLSEIDGLKITFK